MRKITAILPLIVLLLATGCGPKNPLTVVADPKEKPLVRIAAAESIHDAALSGIIVAHREKIVGDQLYHDLLKVSDAFISAMTSLRNADTTGLVLDGNAFWNAGMKAMNTLLTEKQKAGK